METYYKYDIDEGVREGRDVIRETSVWQVRILLTRVYDLEYSQNIFG